MIIWSGIRTSLRVHFLETQIKRSNTIDHRPHDCSSGGWIFYILGDSVVYLQLPLLDIALLKVLGSLMVCALTAITRFWRFRSPQLDVCLLSDRLTETLLPQITKNRQEKSLKILSTSLGKSKSESSLHFDELNMKMCLVFVTDLLSALLILSFPEDIFKMREKKILGEVEIYFKEIPRAW